MSEHSEDKTVLCIKCRSTFSLKEIHDAQAKECPVCGDKGLPGDTNHMAQLNLTHHEWRILFIWAGNWAHHADLKSRERAKENKEEVIDVTHAADTMSAIIREAKRQDPNLPGLTLQEDIQLAIETLSSKLPQGASIAGATLIRESGDDEDIPVVRKQLH